eukprot:5176432-Pleurochrysis_carterae.AAC.2
MLRHPLVPHVPAEQQAAARVADSTLAEQSDLRAEFHTVSKEHLLAARSDLNSARVKAAADKRELKADLR